MGKLAARPQPDAPKNVAALRGKGRHSNAPVIPSILVAVLVVFLAWLAVRWHHSSATDVTADEDGEEESREFDMIRSALFTEEGVPQFEALKDKKNKNNGTAAFASIDYWDERYNKTDKPYDWYGTWSGDTDLTLKQHIAPSLPKPVNKILNIGCGSSRLPQELLDDGFRDITNIDISQVAVNKMAKRFEGKDGVRFMQMDASNMTFEDGSFDVVFDKGTLDALYTGSRELVTKVVPEVFRVLRDGGLFVSITFGAPQTRAELNTTSTVQATPSGWSRFQTVQIARKQIKQGSVQTEQAFYVHLMQKPEAK